MTKTELLELNIQDQNQLINDLDIACRRMEDLLETSAELIFDYPAFANMNLFPILRAKRVEWLMKYSDWDQSLEKINE